MHNKYIRPLSFDTTSAPASFMKYIQQGQILAQNAELPWDMTLDSDGVAIADTAWDLRKLLKDGNPAQAKLRTFSTAPKILSTMITQGLIAPDTSTEPRPVSDDWQNLIKAYAVNHLLVAGLSVQHLSSICGAIRMIASVVNNKAPWRVDSDDLNLAISVMKAAQPSNQSVVVLSAFVKTVIDAYHLFDSCPLYPSIADNRAAGPGKYRAAKFIKREDSLKGKLAARTSEEKLPELRAFWELMRIVFTEKPRTFLDAIRFAQGRILAITGLRIGEISFLPLDWKRTINYRDRDGVAAGTHGGFSNALLLRLLKNKEVVGAKLEVFGKRRSLFRKCLSKYLLRHLKKWND